MNYGQAGARRNSVLPFVSLPSLSKANDRRVWNKHWRGSRQLFVMRGAPVLVFTQFTLEY